MCLSPVIWTNKPLDRFNEEEGGNSPVDCLCVLHLQQFPGLVYQSLSC